MFYVYILQIMHVKLNILVIGLRFVCYLPLHFVQSSILIGYTDAKKMCYPIRNRVRRTVVLTRLNFQQAWQ